MNNIPLAKRMCPESLGEFVGQEHIMGFGKLLRRIIESDKVSSIILYGSPGTGKNAIANIIAKKTKSNFVSINAVTSGVSDIRKIIDDAKELISLKKTILFIDEIHRFNKTQQDALLPDVEDGNIILIGSTTQNPYFYVNSALVSRSLIFQLEPLKNEDIKRIVNRALKDKEKGLGNYNVNITDEAIDHIINVSNGDARISLNALEIGVLTTLPNKNNVINFDIKLAEESIQKRAVVYDKDGDAHYDTISAFIKSMRGSDPDAALYWLAKMIHAGEDPRFIARRIVICAAEDVGNADPQALVIANSALQVSEFVGMPEARIPLAQATVYVACAPKSNAAYLGIESALSDIEKEKTMEVPGHLKDANYPGAEKLGHGKGYKYAHDYEGHFVEQEYVPKNKKYYNPTDIGFEAKIKSHLDSLRKKKEMK